MFPFGTFGAIEQPFKLSAPAPGHPLNEPPTMVIGPFVVIPAGKVSAMVIAAIVGPFDTAIRIV